MKHPVRWFATGALLLMLLGIAVYLVKPLMVKETIELIVQGGERELRDPLRPPQAQPHLLIFALDGVGADEFYEAVRSGATPNIQKLLGAETRPGVFEHGYAVPDAMSILPSTTMAAWSSIYTGQPPAYTGVPGNEWFAREEMRFYAPAPVSITESVHTLKMLTDGLVGNALQVPTLYELLGLRSYVSLAPVYRGADLFTMPESLFLVDLFKAAAEGLTGNMTVSQEAYREVDQESVDKVIEALAARGIPNLQVVYFPGIDLFSHVAEHPLDRQESYLRTVLDPAIGRIFDVYEKAGVLDETYVLFIADHGHTPVLNDDRHSLATVGDDEPPALIERTGFRLRPFVIDPPDDQQDYQATVAYQGAIAYIYLADRSTCPARGDRCDWQRAPRLAEDVMPIVQAFHRVNQSGAPIPELKGTIDLIFAREPRPTSASALPFRIFDDKKLVPVADYLRANPRPDLIRLEERMLGLGAGPYGHRAGDVLLLTHSGLNHPVENRFYFSNVNRSWHGSPTAQDSHVPFVLARRADSGANLQGIINRVTGKAPSHLHVVPLLRCLTGLKVPHERAQGVC